VSHSRKILSQAGVSLADVYEIEGSVVGLENLDVGDIQGVHDLGPQIQSERLRTFYVTLATGDILQNIAFEVIAGGIPDSVNRILGVQVIFENAGRLDFASLSISDSVTGNEIPIWVWDKNDDPERRMRWSISGAAVVQDIQCQPLGPSLLPYLITRHGDSGLMPNLIFRGQADGFGAGNMNARCVVALCRPNTGNPGAGEPSSHGLPIPGW